MSGAGSEPAFLGSGWAFPVRLEDGHIAQATGDDAVRDAIRLILGTAPGERVMNPGFGCRVGDSVFGLNGAGTAGAVSQAVREALNQWERRIDVLDVTTVPDPADPHRLAVTISYRVRSSNSRENLVYPFFLG